MSDVFDNLIETLGSWWSGMVENLPQMVGGILIFIFFIYFARVVRKLVLKALKARETDNEISLLI